MKAVQAMTEAQRQAERRQRVAKSGGRMVTVSLEPAAAAALEGVCAVRKISKKAAIEAALIEYCKLAPE